MPIIKREGEKNLQDLYKVYVREGGILSYIKYKEVVSLFMKEIIEKIIKVGYEFSMPYHVGLIKVVQLERIITVKEDGKIRASIDWGESNKLKAKLIKEGKVPLEAYKDENGKKTGGHNNGVPWLCYFTSPTFFRWVWTAHVNQPNCLQYTFDITSTNASALSKSITDKSYILFKLRNRNGTNKDYLDAILTASRAKQVQNK